MAEPIVVEGRVLVPAGATGAGEVVHAAKAGGMGKAGELLLAVRYLEVNGQRLPLRSLRYGRSQGKDNSGAVVAGNMVAAAVLPVASVVGFLIKGKSAFPRERGPTRRCRRRPASRFRNDPGQGVILMRLMKFVLLGAVAGMAVPAVAAEKAGKSASEKAAPAVPAPGAGMGQIVFYRSSRMGALISCKVHENGAVVNRLPPGKYFIHQTTPGAHEYSVKSEATDKIRVEVEEGETQYVRCAIGAGIGLGRPNLSPQSREDFEKRGKGLDLLPPYKADSD